MGNIADSVLFRPPEQPTYLHPWRYFFLQSSNGEGRIPAFFIKRPDAKATILFSHGSREDLGMIFDELKAVAAYLNVNILAFDYTGYGLGKRGGRPTEKQSYADIEVAYKHLVKRREVSPDNIVLVGRGIGNGPTAYMAAKCSADGVRCSGVILISPFTSLFRFMGNMTKKSIEESFPSLSTSLPTLNVPYNLWCDKFPVIKFMKKVKRIPTLIVHRTNEKEFHGSYGKTILNALPPESSAMLRCSTEMEDMHFISRRVNSELIETVRDFLNRRAYERYRPEV